MLSIIVAGLKKPDKKMQIPPAVAKIIRIVYLDRVAKLSDLRKMKGYEVDVIEYRKWVREQSSKKRKDALMKARVEVSDVSSESIVLQVLEMFFH